MNAAEINKYKEYFRNSKKNPLVVGDIIVLDNRNDVELQEKFFDIMIPVKNITTLVDGTTIHTRTTYNPDSYEVDTYVDNRGNEMLIVVITEVVAVAPIEWESMGSRWTVYDYEFASCKTVGFIPLKRALKLR